MPSWRAGAGRVRLTMWEVSDPNDKINVLELSTVLRILKCLHWLMRSQHVLVRTVSRTTAAYINRQGCVHSQTLHHVAVKLSLWASTHLLSLEPYHIAGASNVGADLMF